jgi:hypothetical protein
MVHDERMAADLGGAVPLVLAGHTHDPVESRIAPPDADDEPGEEADDATSSESATTATDTPTSGPAGDDEPDDTLLLVEGSTGGAGLRGLQGEEPEPLSASILYFDPDTRSLVAYDRITVAWLEDAGATIERHIVGETGDDQTA